MLEAIDGFILVLGTDGHILYTSESLASLLGYLPSSLHNTTLYEIVADGDKIPLYNTLNVSHNSESSDQHQVQIGRQKYIKSRIDPNVYPILDQVDDPHQTSQCSPRGGGRGGHGANLRAGRALRLLQEVGQPHRACGELCLR